MGPCPTRDRLSASRSRLFLLVSRLSKTVRAAYHLLWWLPGNHLLFLYVVHMTWLWKGSGMVSPGIILEVVPSGLRLETAVRGWEPRRGPGIPTYIPGCRGRAATKERGTPCAGEPTYSLIKHRKR